MKLKGKQAALFVGALCIGGLFAACASTKKAAKDVAEVAEAYVEKKSEELLEQAVKVITEKAVIYRDTVYESSRLGLVVSFGFDSAELGDPEPPAVAGILAFLEKHPGNQALLIGHADERGSAEYNHVLGLYRAQAVRDRLLEYCPECWPRVDIVSKGKKEPTGKGHEADRRVEVLGAVQVKKEAK